MIRKPEDHEYQHFLEADVFLPEGLPPILQHARWVDVATKPTPRRDWPTGGRACGGGVNALAGPTRANGDTDTVRAGDFTTTNTPLGFEAGDFVARITFRDDRTIAGLYISIPDVAGGGGGSAAM